MGILLDIENVSYSYHTRENETAALEDISFKVSDGEFVAIVGPSGCGKSTLLSLIAGLLEPEKGRIDVNCSNIGYMLQRDHLFEWRTIYKNVTLGLEIRKEYKNKEKKSQRLNEINKMIDNYGLGDFKEAKPSQLSGGMRQRAALIRTLALEPDILLLDEPFSALDYQTRLEVADDIYRIIKKEGKTAMLVTHDLSEAISMGDRIIVLGKRPAKIKRIVNINFDVVDQSPMKVRNASEFKDYFNMIWKELREDE